MKKNTIRVLRKLGIALAVSAVLGFFAGTGWGIALAVFCFIGILGNEIEEPKRDGSRQSPKPPNLRMSKDVPGKVEETPANETESVEVIAQKIADEVTTLAQFRSLKNKLDKANDTLANLSINATDATIDRHEARVNLLEEAYYIAGNKAYRWQFLPMVGIETELKIIKASHKVFTPSKYKEALEKLSSDERYWEPLVADCDPEEKIEEEIAELNFYSKFRVIVENDALSQEEKSKKINALVSKNKDIAESHFDLESDESAADQWFNKTYSV